MGDRSTPRIVPTILIDSREQRPLIIRGYPWRRVTLEAGDYGVSGFSDWSNPRFIIERKSVDDLVSSLTRTRDRFFRELQLLRRFEFAALLVEGTRSDIALRRYRSEATPASMIASLAAIQARGGIHVIYAEDADGAAEIVEDLVHAFVGGVIREFGHLTPREESRTAQPDQASEPEEPGAADEAAA